MKPVSDPAETKKLDVNVDEVETETKTTTKAKKTVVKEMPRWAKWALSLLLLLVVGLGFTFYMYRKGALAENSATATESDKMVQIIKKEKADAEAKAQADAKEAERLKKEKDALLEEKAGVAETLRLSQEKAAKALEQLQTERSEKQAQIDQARLAAAAEVTDAKNKLKAEAEAAFPGEARIVVETFDPKIHVRKQGQKIAGERRFQVEEALPPFSISTKPRDIRAKVNGEEKIVKGVYFVLATDGRPLVLGTTPTLKNGINPYRLEVEGSEGWKEVWCAQPN